MLRRESPSFEVDQHLSGPVALGVPQGEVDLAAEHELVVNVIAEPAFGDRPPPGLQRRKALKELHNSVVALGPQLGPFGLADCL